MRTSMFRIAALFAVCSTVLGLSVVEAQTNRQSVMLRPGALATGTGTMNYIAKWNDNAGLLGDSMIFQISSRIGIGTTNPVTMLQVGLAGADLPNMPGTVLYVVNPSGSAGLALRDTFNHVELAIGTAALGPPGQFVGLFGTRTNQDLYLQANGNNRAVIKTSGFVGIGTLNPTQLLDVNGNINVVGNIAAKYQDVAEWVPTTSKMDAGTVVVLNIEGTNEVMPSSRAYDTAVAGVVSAQPGIILGEKSDDKAMIATTGRVKVRVDATRGAILPGDLLVTSDEDGMAMKSQPIKVGGALVHRPGTIVGKALEALPSGKGEILVLLTLQ